MAVAYLLLLCLFLLLPPLLYRAGLPPRSEAYKSITSHVGSIGEIVRAIYQDRSDGDIVFLGSSLTNAAISQPTVHSALAAHLGRSAHTAVLALNWQGVDLQYYMLRDYLSTHKLRLLVWNLPQPHSRVFDQPHRAAFSFIRFGEYPDALDGLAFHYRVALFAEMVLGAPRQVLSRLRPNRLGPEAMDLNLEISHLGYYSQPFVEDSLPPAVPQRDTDLLDLNSPLLRVEGPGLGPYNLHFARKILALAASHGCTVLLLHIPLDAEIGLRTVPEIADWSVELHTDSRILAIPSADFFPGMDKSRVLHFYRDRHLNGNGRTAFTNRIIPSLLRAYDQANISR